MIEERYLSATAAKNLRDEPHQVGQVDLIKASGMTGRNMAAHYLRLISKPTQADMTRVYAALLYVVQSRGVKGGTDAIVAALTWLLDPQCKVCNGSGIVVKVEKEHKCPKCKGEKLRKEPGCPDAQILIDYVTGCRHRYGGDMLRKLR